MKPSKRAGGLVTFAILSGKKLEPILEANFFGRSKLIAFHNMRFNCIYTMFDSNIGRECETNIQWSNCKPHIKATAKCTYETDVHWVHSLREHDHTMVPTSKIVHFENQLKDDLTFHKTLLILFVDLWTTKIDKEYRSKSPRFSTCSKDTQNFKFDKKKQAQWSKPTFTHTTVLY